MWPEVGDPTGLQPGVHNAPDRPRIDATAAGSHEQRGPSGWAGEHPPPGIAPRIEAVHGGQPDRDGAFLAALAEDAHYPSLAVDVVEIKTHQLAHANAGRVKQLEDRAVAQRDSRAFRVIRVCASCLGFFGQPVEHSCGVGLLEDGGQRATGLSGHEMPARIVSQEAPAYCPRREHTRGSCPARQGGPRPSGGAQPRQPAAEYADVEASEVVHAKPDRVVQESGDVAGVGPHGVHGQASLGAQVSRELVDQGGERRWQFW
jgi:hypothetical protein